MQLSCGVTLRAALQTPQRWLRGLLLSAGVRADQILQESSMPSANGHGGVRQDRYQLCRHRARGAQRVPRPEGRVGAQACSQLCAPVHPGCPSTSRAPSSLSLNSQAHRIRAGGSGSLTPLIPQLSPGRDSSGLTAPGPQPARKVTVSTAEATKRHQETQLLAI